jgi:small-conductance mechanosensitive channel
MNKNIINLTRGTIYLLVAGVIIVCTILMPELIREEAAGKPNVQPAYSFLLVVWALALPVLTALFQVNKIVDYIDENKAFSDKSVKALQIIKICAVVFATMIVAAVTTLFAHARTLNPPEDVAGFGTIGFVFVFASGVIATFTAVLQKILQNVIDMKLENESTI